ncbi:AbrB/MazE/SpoVT family DNA-binding domain-containing protein [Gracilibacillus alcaliphilus]|uniref:AbrB/MazE/SpoVT family DNA-binding domain-containing protein n=1 Tax=Gracilibacillus alcaliphilus TaxID=1401441 RepID=UPI00195AAC37|nr:AbrB/MazE/SpoVT family DNA-binding domain-containing protein [Gracilibacillus alcaliphilus]MBM7679639.1 bifunctional DNA-binding transcriptional regulator/antitoxin component of YhaV-PrlF toxin-antitoxin module [Gracilibacillus alcaliphilus]
MKTTGIKKKIINGRVVIPYQIREMYRLENGDQVHLRLEGSQIIITKPDQELTNTDVLSKIDELGRVRIPAYMRDYLRISTKQPIVISMEGNHIVIECAQIRCAVTGNFDSDIYYVGNGNIPVSLEGAEKLLKEIQEKKLSVSTGQGRRGDK